MAVRVPSPSLNSSGIFLFGHFWMHSPQPVQSFSSSFRAFLRTVTLKLPMKPSTFSTSL